MISNPNAVSRLWLLDAMDMAVSVGIGDGLNFSPTTQVVSDFPRWSGSELQCSCSASFLRIVTLGIALGDPSFSSLFIYESDGVLQTKESRRLEFSCKDKVR